MNPTHPTPDELWESTAPGSPPAQDELSESAQRVQRVLVSNGTPTYVRNSMKEAIMSSLSLTLPSAPVSNRTRAANRPITHNTVGWYAAWIGLLVAALVLANLGNFFVRDQPLPTPAAAPTNLGLARLTQTTGYGCDFSTPPLDAGSFPIANTTSVFNSENGELRLFCPSPESDGYFHELAAWYKSRDNPMPTLPQSSLLVENALIWYPTIWPETIVVTYMDKSRPTQLAQTKYALINLNTGAQMLVDSEKNLLDTAEIHQPASGLWWIVPNADSGELQMVNLRTLEQTSLPETVNPSSRLATGSYGVSSRDGSISAFMLLKPGDPASDPNAAPTATGSVLVMNEGGEPRVLELPEDIRAVAPISMSPDGRYLAIPQSSSGHDDLLINQIAIVDVQSGEVIVETSQTEAGSINEFAWTLDSNSLVYTVGNQLHVLDADASAEPQAVFELGQRLEHMRPTVDADTVVVDVARSDDPKDTETWVVGIRTGDATQLTGSASGSPGPSISGVVNANNHSLPETRLQPILGVAMFDYVDGELATVRLVDPLTDETIVATDYDPESDPGILPNLSSTFDAVVDDVRGNPYQVSALANGTVVVQKMENNVVETTLVSSGERQQIGFPYVSVNPRGYASIHFVSADGDSIARAYRLALLPEPTWIPDIPTTTRPEATPAT